ncbi:hypothetical protein TcWFU_008498 [Taenia crassiceps]|uniref:Uncharacterized protein n=1 Tax=Taenia crassiceps TaxID=6207 RepID=A0ABR4PZZ3_9CEST
MQCFPQPRSRNVSRLPILLICVWIDLTHETCIGFRNHKRDKEKNSLLEAMARVTVNEAINLAVAELKAEAVEAFAASAKQGVVEKAVELLNGLADSSVTRSKCRRSRRGCLLYRGTRNPKVDGTSLWRNAVISSKEVLNDALQRMTLSANTDSMKKPQSKIISVLAKAASNAAEREERRVRIDRIMSRVRAPSATPSPVQPVAKALLGVAAENNNLGPDDVKGLQPRHRLRSNGAIRSMLASGLLSSNSKAALLLQNHLDRNEQALPPLELCSPCAETSSVSDIEQHSTNERNNHCHGSEINLNTQLAKQSTYSPIISDEDPCTHEIGDWHSSCTFVTTAARYPVNGHGQSDRLASTHHSSCSDVSTTSGLQQ